MRKLKPKKIKYSERQGLSVEWERPDEVVIDSLDMISILIYLRGFPDQQAMDENFTLAEQEVIQKFAKVVEQCQFRLLSEYRDKASLKKIKSDFRRYLDWWSFCYEDGIEEVMAQLWGWKLTAKETLPLVDQLILGALESDVHHDLYRINSLIASYLGNPKMGEPLPETIAKVETVFGPLDWPKLKEEGKQRYERFQKSR